MNDAASARLGLDVPEGWQIRQSTGPFGFVTRALVTGPDGVEVEWSTRRHRKGLAPRAAPARRVERPRDLIAAATPRSRWLGGLFMGGSACFALGSTPLVFDHADASSVAWLFFVGSILFTLASYVQFRECIAASPTVDPAGRGARGLRGIVGWRPRSLGWWGTAVQLVGAVAFNVSTLSATQDVATLERERELIWGPDALGSACFLVASWLAYVEVAPRPAHPPRRDLGVHIAIVNLMGSIAFGAAAVGSRYLVTTGEPANIATVNIGTFTGAVCFFIGAALLPVESATDGMHSQPAVSPA